MKKSELEQIIKEEIQNALQEGVLSKLFRRSAKKKAATKPAKPKYKGSAAASKTINPKQIDYPDWLKKKINDVHGKQGQGSVFSKQVITQLPDLIGKEASKQSAQILNHFATKQTPYFLKFKKTGAGHELIATKVQGGWATPGGKMIPNAKVGKSTKREGPNLVEVPRVDITLDGKSPVNLRDFETDEITALIVPARKGGPQGPPIKGKYTIITAFPGGDLPRASEWAGKYAVVTARAPKQRALTKADYEDQMNFLSGYQGSGMPVPNE